MRTTVSKTWVSADQPLACAALACPSYVISRFVVSKAHLSRLIIMIPQFNTAVRHLALPSFGHAFLPPFRALLCSEEQ